MIATIETAKLTDMDLDSVMYRVEKSHPEWEGSRLAQAETDYRTFFLRCKKAGHNEVHS